MDGNTPSTASTAAELAQLREALNTLATYADSVLDDETRDRQILAERMVNVLAALADGDPPAQALADEQIPTTTTEE